MITRYVIDSVRFPNRGYVANSADIALIMGRVGHHWPAEGMPIRTIKVLRKVRTEIRGTSDLQIWVVPAYEPTGRKSSIHRVFCLCPGCSLTFSAGRLSQHKCRA